ncbi:bacterial Ig-like domain-containing protein [Holzapfeliella sp. JNUCC 80]
MDNVNLPEGEIITDSLPTSLLSITIKDSNLTSNQIDNGFNLPNLTSLTLDSGSLVDVNFLKNSNLTSLYSLSADVNEISDITAFKSANLPNLREISLSYNKIRDFTPLLNYTFENINNEYPSFSADDQQVTINETMVKPTEDNTKYTIDNSYENSGALKVNKYDFDQKKMVPNLKNEDLFFLVDEDSRDDYGFVPSEVYDGVVQQKDIDEDNDIEKVRQFSFEASPDDLPERLSYAFSDKYSQVQGRVIYNINWIDSQESLTVQDTSVDQYTSFVPKNQFIQITDKYGKSVDASQVTVQGNVDTTKPGKYEVTYSYGEQSKKAFVTVEPVSAVVPEHLDKTLYIDKIKQLSQKISDQVESNSKLTNLEKQQVIAKIDEIEQSNLSKIDEATSTDQLDSILNETLLKGIVNHLEEFINGILGTSSTIYYIPGYGVQNWLFDDNNQVEAIPNSFTPSQSRVQVFGSKWFDNVKYSRINGYNNNFWIQTQYLLQPVETDLTAIATVGNTPTANYAVYLRDSTGDITTQTVMPGTSWLVFAQKKIGGQSYYRIGNENQWIQAEFAKLS